MNVLVVPSINLPMPAVKGGAVQNLVMEYLRHNDADYRDSIDVVSIYDQVAVDAAGDLAACRFHYLKPFNDGLTALTKKTRLFGLLYRFRQKKFLEFACSLAKKNKYDVILLENTPQFAVRFRECCGADTRTLLHLHNDYVSPDNEGSREVLDALDGVACVSGYIKSRVDAVKPGLAKVVYNCTTMDCTPADPTYIEKLRRDYSIGDRKVIVSTGRLCADKGFHVLLQALQGIRNADKCMLFVIGGVTYSDNTEDEYVAQLKALASDCKCEVVFTGYVDNSLIPNYLELADIGVLPSQWEDPFPLTVLEYMRYGLATVVTDSGGIPEAVDDSCAIAVPRGPEMVEQLTQAIDRLVSDDVLLETMGKCGEERSRLFSTEKYVTSVHGFLAGE